MTETNRKKAGILKRWFRRSLITVLLMVMVWLIADFGYSLYVANGIASWEKSANRNQQGVRFGCESYSIGPTDSKTTVLMVHGISDSPHVYRKVSNYLADHGVRCRAMRMPGFGESVDRYQAASTEDWIESVDREIKQLKAADQEIILVAHSLGGAVVIQYLENHPDVAKALVLAAPAIEVSSHRSPVFPVRTWHSLLNRVLLFSEVTYSPFGVDALDPSERKNEYRTPYTPVKVIDQVFELIDRNRDAATQIKMPLLMVLASDDQVIDNQAALKFFDRVPNRDKEKILLDRSAHAILVDYQWKEFSDSLIVFVKKHTSLKATVKVPEKDSK